MIMMITHGMLHCVAPPYREAFRLRFQHMRFTDKCARFHGNEV